MHLSLSDLPSTLGVIPLRNAVLFPGGALPLSLSERCSQVIDDASEGYVVIVARRDSASEGVGAADLFEVGTLGRIVKVDRTTREYAVTVHGLTRCRLRLLPEALRARVEVISSDDALDEAGTERIRSLGLQIIHRSPGLPEAALSLVRDIEVSGHLIDLLVANLELAVSDKQLVLETARVTDRAELATRLLTPLLSRLPAPSLSGSQCGLHGVPAVATCARCGAFICEGCRGPGGASDVCKACRSRTRPVERVPQGGAAAAVLFSGLASGLTAFGVYRSFSNHPASRLTFIACALVGGAAGLGWLWSRRQLPRPRDSWEFWAALLTLVVNGLILFVWME